MCFAFQCTREGFFQKIKDEEGEGCNIFGSLEVNRIAGNFHFVAGKSFQQSNLHFNDLVFQTDSYNVRDISCFFPINIENGILTSVLLYPFLFSLVLPSFKPYGA